MLTPKQYMGFWPRVVIQSLIRIRALLLDLTICALGHGDLHAIAQKGGAIGMWPLAREEMGETFDDFLRDIHYVKALVGIEHIGIGTDLNGVRTMTMSRTHKEFALITAPVSSKLFRERHH